MKTLNTFQTILEIKGRFYKEVKTSLHPPSAVLQCPPLSALRPSSSDLCPLRALLMRKFSPKVFCPKVFCPKIYRIGLTPLYWPQVGCRTSDVGQGQCQEKFFLVGRMGRQRMADKKKSKKFSFCPPLERGDSNGTTRPSS